jgi:hypothetical protein
MKTWSRSKTVVARFRGAEGPAALQVIGDYANDSIGHLPGDAMGVVRLLKEQQPDI